jgi:PadR family transcriptional regulator, regulatory protein PadR
MRTGRFRNSSFNPVASPSLPAPTCKWWCADGQTRASSACFSALPAPERSGICSSHRSSSGGLHLRKRNQADTEMLKGALDMMVLRTLVTGDAHGHTIAKVVERTSEDVLEVERGSLPHRLGNRGWVSSYWGASENNRKAKFYRLTASRRQETPWPRDKLLEADGSRDWSGNRRERPG